MSPVIYIWSVIALAQCMNCVYGMNNSQDDPRHERVRRATCSADWTDVSGVCVAYGDTPMTWWTAHLNCVERGGYLANKDDINVPLQVVVCPTGSNPNNDETFCYELTDTKGTLKDAHDYCQSKGGIVPDVTSNDDIQFILGEVTAVGIPSPSVWSNGLWIGQNLDNLGSWVYSSDTGKSIYTDWGTNQPDGAGLEQCAVLIYDSSEADEYGKMHDTMCDNAQHNIMCQYNAGAWVGALWVDSAIQFLDTVVANPTWVAGAVKTDQCAFELSDGTWDTSICTSLRPYVCREGTPPSLQQSTIDAILTHVAQDDIACPIDNAPIGSFYNPESQTCYWFTASPNPRASAMSECETDHNASLAVIDDEQEGNFIFTKALQNLPNFFYIWIGLQYVTTEWVDIDGNPPIYTHWKGGVLPSGTGCAVIEKSSNGQWGSMSCTAPFSGVCELKVTISTTNGPTISEAASLPQTSPEQGSNGGDGTELSFENILHAMVTDSAPIDKNTASGILVDVTTQLGETIEQLSSTSLAYLLDITMAIVNSNSVSEDIFEKLLYICDFVLRENNQETLLDDNNDDAISEMLDMADRLSKLAATEKDVINEDQFIEDNLDLHIIGNIDPDGQDYYFEVGGTGYNSAIILPKELFGHVQGTVSVLVVKNVYETSLESAFLHKPHLDNEKFNSFIYSVSFVRDDGQEGTFGEDFVTFYFEKLEDPNDEQRCVFWDANISDWSVVGCELDLAASNQTHTVCHCNHLTNFAILMQFNEPVDLGVHEDVLEYLTYIGTSISVLCLVVTLLIYLLGKLLKSERIILHSNLAMALLLGQVLFISGIDATSNSTICKAIAVMLHYFFLSAFSWMLVEGIHLYTKSALVFGRNIKTWIYLLLGWGLPVIVVGITFGVRYDGYGAEGSGKCWLSTEEGLSWAFIGPVLAIILINTAILIMVIRVFMTLKANADKSDVQRLRVGIRAILMLQPLLGISWLFGVFSVNEHTIIFQYLFVICNSLQGVFIFICHCITNEEVRSIFLRRYKKMASSVNTSSFATASSTITETTQAGLDSKKGNNKQAWK